MERGTYAEVLDVAEDLVVQGKVVGGDDINTGILLDLPVSEPEPLGLGEKLILRDLAAPVWFAPLASVLNWKVDAHSAVLLALTSLSSLLQVTVDSHARETENGGLNHDC